MDTKKVVINVCYGGYGLSAEALKRIAKYTDRECYFFTVSAKNIYTPTDGMDKMFAYAFDIPDMSEDKNYDRHYIGDFEKCREHPVLIRVIEELGSEAASGRCAKLKIVEIPIDVEYEIAEYDGAESIHEVHRMWV